MDYRKLISFGKSSYVISLPRSWIEQNKLKKGDLIKVDCHDQELILSQKEDSKIDHEREITINVEGKSVRRIQREIISAYIKDYKTIILIGNDLKTKAKKVQDTIQNLMALEVMEQTSSKIVARDFLNMNNISVFNLIRKMDVIVRAMIEDCENMFSEDTYENIFHRDNDVNRLCFLIFRVIEYALDNPSYAYKSHKLSSRHLLYLWWFVFNVESVGDEVKRISRYMREIKLSDKEKKRFLSLLAQAKDSYLSVMKGFYNNDEELAHKVIEGKDGLIEGCGTFYLDNKKTDYSGLLAERLKCLATNIHNLSRVVYQFGFTK